jgi:hypothetical protein
MSAALEAFLARLYVDAPARERFLRSPREEALRAGLAAPEAAALERIDRAGLELAARSFARKRAQAATRPPRRGLRALWARLRRAPG